MNSVKQQISEWLDVEASRLNEISLEDVRFVPFVQDNIGNAVVQMLTPDGNACRYPGLSTYQTDGIPCKGFWVEDTRELVLYIRINSQLKAIVVPNDGWTIREDITLN
jgi:hypothetical protein